MTNTTLIENTESMIKIEPDVVKRIGQKYGDPDWLIERRLKALEYYNRCDLPDRVTHLWRYTDPNLFTLNNLEDDTKHDVREVSKADLKLFKATDDLDGFAWIQRGRHTHVNISPALQQRGVLLCDLHEAANNHASIIQSRLGLAVSEGMGKFEALNMALWQLGLFLHVPKGTVIEKPIHLVITGDASLNYFAPRLLVNVEEGSQLTLIVEYSSPEGIEFYANSAVEFISAPATNVRYINIQNWGNKVTSYFTQRSILERDANLFTIWAGFGSKLTKADIGTRLIGRGASTKMWGMTFAQENQHFDQHTEHLHEAPHTSSNMDFKVVLKDNAHSIYTGLIKIGEKVTDCEAYQENRNLILNEGAHADTIPELEILNDEVRCTHGATIGPVREEELFYLASRGVPREEAIKIIVKGFVESSLKEAPDNLQKRLRAYVTERLKEI